MQVRIPHAILLDAVRDAGQAVFGEDGLLSYVDDRGQFKFLREPDPDGYHYSTDTLDDIGKWHPEFSEWLRGLLAERLEVEPETL